MELGTRIDETGTLLRDGGGFVLRRDTGGRWGLDLSRAPVDRIERHVRIIGTLVADGRVEVEAIGPAGTLFGDID